MVKEPVSEPKKSTRQPKAKAAPAEQKKNKAPIKLELIVTVVPKKKAEFFIDLIQSYEVNFQTYMLASGTASTEILNYLGQVTDKIAIFSLARADKVDDILYALEQKFHTIKGGKGIAVTLPMTSLIGTSIYTFLCNAVEAAPGGM
ncbi:MAG: hypothetical protein IJR88_05080 [Clostridia bacterium]|nr:hypothetical protein [Clostridia bacterium]